MNREIKETVIYNDVMVQVLAKENKQLKEAYEHLDKYCDYLIDQTITLEQQILILKEKKDVK